METSCRSVLNMPEEFSILTLQKVLTLFQHLLTHGSDRCVELSMNMGHLIERMKKWVELFCVQVLRFSYFLSPNYFQRPSYRYNTAISTQRVSFFAQLKGGAVDQAFVVRQMASDLCKLLKDKPQISKLRMDNLDPNSLVPVGTGNQVGFAPTPSTAQEWMEEQRRKEAEVSTKNRTKLWALWWCVMPMLFLLFIIIHILFATEFYINYYLLYNLV